MADENTPKPDSTGFPDVSKNNAEVAAALIDQGKVSTAPDVNVETGDALDALVKQKAVAEDPTTEEAARKAAEEEAARKAAEADPEKQAEVKAAAEKSEAEKKRVEEIFKDAPGLPPNSSPKAAESFSAVKVKAAQEISAREQQIEELKKKNQELETKVKTPVPEEVTRELEDLRQWRAKLDVEVDPKFKEYEKTISTSQEFIYAQLKKSPKITDETIAAIKKHGGPENINLTKIFEEIADPTIQRLVESKVADIEMAKFHRDQAVKSAKENITTYMADRQKQWDAAATQHNSDTAAVLNQHIPKLEYMQEKPIPAGADVATKKSIEAHNAFVKETNGYVQAALKDDSPDMRAVMIIGMAQLLYLKPQLSAATARVTQLEKDLKEAQEKIDKFKGASVSRLRESAVAPGGKTPDTKPSDQEIFHGDTRSALDKIAQQVTAERERRAAGGA